MANEEIIAFSNADFSEAAPYEIWDGILAGSSFQSHVAPDASTGKAVFKVDLDEDGININEDARNALIAAYNNVVYTDESGVNAVRQFEEFRDVDGNYVPFDILINDPASIVELFVEVNPRGEVTPIVRIDNTSLDNRPAVSTHISLGNAQIDDARKTTERARAEWESKGYDSNRLKDLRIRTDVVFFSVGTQQEQQQVSDHYNEIHITGRADAVLNKIESDIMEQHFDLASVKEHYDKEHLAREIAWFERTARKEMEKLWADFEKNFPYESDTPEGQAAKQAIRDRLENICKNTVIEFEHICGDAYERNGRVVDRNLIQTIREAGKSLLAKFKEVAKDFLDKAKDVLTKERVIFVRDGAEDIQMDVSKKDFSTLKELAAKAKESAPEERASALERLKNKINELADKANGEIREHGKSLRESVFAKLAAAKAGAVKFVKAAGEAVYNLDEAVEKVVDKVGDAIVRADDAVERKLQELGLVGLEPKGFEKDFLNRVIDNDSKMFTKALGANIIYDKTTNLAKELQVVPSLSETELASLARRVDDEIAGKPLSEWIKDPNVKVELVVGVPIDELGKPNGEKASLTDHLKSVFVKDMPASIFVTDRSTGNDIGSAGVALSKAEMSNISRTVDKSKLGEKAVAIAEIADIVDGTNYSKGNADKWVRDLKKLSCNELDKLASHLGTVESLGKDPSAALKTKLDNIKDKGRG